MLVLFALLVFCYLLQMVLEVELLILLLFFFKLGMDFNNHADYISNASSE